MAALEAITTRKSDWGHRAIYVLLENSATIQTLLTGLTTSSSWRVQKFWKMNARAAVPVKLGWFPGHSGLPENETADRLARREIDSPDNARITNDRMTLASSGRHAHQLARQMMIDWRHSNRPKRYANLKLEMWRKKPPELAPPRAVHARLIAVLFGRRDFADDHHRFNHMKATLRCDGGRENIISHLFQCRKSLET